MKITFPIHILIKCWIGKRIQRTIELLLNYKSHPASRLSSTVTSIVRHDVRGTCCLRWMNTANINIWGPASINTIVFLYTIFYFCKAMNVWIFLIKTTFYVVIVHLFFMPMCVRISFVIFFIWRMYVAGRAETI